MNSERLSAIDDYHDKVVAIEAVKCFDLWKRLPEQPASRQPLEDVSNRSSPAGSVVSEKPVQALQAHRPPVSPAVTKKPQASRGIWSSASSKPPSRHSRRLNADPSHNSLAARPTNDHFFHPDMEDTTLMTFTAFACERREVFRRYKSGSDRDQEEDAIKNQWRQMSLTDRQYYKNRSSSILSKAIHLPNLPPASLLIFNFMGFWSLYYARLEYQSDKAKYFDSILDDWGAAGVDIRLHYIKPYVEDLRRYPITLPEGPPFATSSIATTKLHQPDDGLKAIAIPTVKTESEVKDEPVTEMTETVNKSTVDEPPTFNIPDLFTNCTTEQLEHGVKEGVQLLEKIRNVMEAQAQSQGVAQWMENIQRVADQAQQSKTIVGVVGNTGAGKSSVINALLDEERLVPTNCMRACTAVVTEISYNHEEVPYRGEIEFISADAWRDEMKILYQDLLDANGGFSRDCYVDVMEYGLLISSQLTVF